MVRVLWQGQIKNALLGYFIVLMSVILFLTTIFTNQFARPEKQLQGTMWIPFAFIMALMALAGIVFTQLTVQVREKDFVIAFGPLLWPAKYISYDHVVSVRTLNVRPTEWGGWGYRWVPWRKATAAVMRAGEGLHFTFANGKQFVVTIDNADIALEAIRRAMDELPPSN